MSGHWNAYHIHLFIFRSVSNLQILVVVYRWMGMASCGKSVGIVIPQHPEGLVSFQEMVMVRTFSGAPPSQTVVETT